MLKSRNTKLKKVCLVAVDIRSSHNVGSLFRTCDGLGADLILCGITPRPGVENDERLPHIIRRVEKEISKTALGAEKYTNWQYFNDFSLCASYLRKEGYRISALEQSVNSKDISNLKSTAKLAIILGRELEGLSVDELKLCDDIFEIPMQGKKESLNVSVAAAIALYQAKIS